MVDIVDQLREVRSKNFHPDSLRTMVLWGADEIERLRTAIKGAEIALARDEDIDGAIHCLLSVYKTGATP